MKIQIKSPPYPKISRIYVSMTTEWQFEILSAVTPLDYMKSW